jgi:hypothetical protein
MGGLIMASTINADTTNGVVVTSDTSGEIELQANGVTKAKVTANGLQDANGNSLRGGSFRNLLINGDMRIAQRGTSETGLGVTVKYANAPDRVKWVGLGSGTYAFTASQDTDVPSGQGFANSYKVDNTTAQASLSADAALFLSISSMEGQNLQQLKKGTANAESLTASFWVKSNKTGTYICELYDADNIRHICSAYTISSANTWEKKTITFAGDTTGAFDNDNARSFEFITWLAAGSNYTSGTLATSWASLTAANRAVGQTNLADSTANYINITGVQLEVGEGASDFEFLPYDVQLARCQRYFSTSYGNNPVGTNTWDGTVAGRNYDTSSRSENVVNIHYPVQMRALPTLTAYSKAGTSGKLVAGSTSVDVSTTEIACSLKGSATIIRAVTGAAVGGTHWYQFHYTASAEL